MSSLNLSSNDITSAFLQDLHRLHWKMSALGFSSSTDGKGILAMCFLVFSNLVKINLSEPCKFYV